LWGLVAEPTLRKDVKWVKGKEGDQGYIWCHGEKKDEVEVVPLDLADNPGFGLRVRVTLFGKKRSRLGWTRIYIMPKGRHLSNSYNPFPCSQRSSRSITRYQLLKPPRGLRHPQTCNKARSSLNQRREPNFRRPLYDGDVLEHLISLRFHPTQACPLC